MKFIRFQIEDRVTVGVLSPDGASAIELVSLQEELQGDDLPALLQKLDDKTVADLQKLLQTGAYGPQGIYPLEEVRLLSPVGRPIHDIICVGVNYYDHLEETKKFDSSVTGKKKTVYFSKRTTGLKGPGEKIQFMPALDSALDYEVELAVIIGKKGVNIPREKAEEYIFGYSVFNDVSARSLQTAHVQWYKGKSLDSFCCLGPWIVSKDELPLPLSLQVESRVNGEVRQHSATSRMMNDVAGIISEFSQGITLEPGDIIATGTPSGVGMGFKPPKYMKKSDTVECEIEKIGVLKNIVG